MHLFCISEHYVPFGGGQEVRLVTWVLLYASVRQRKGSTCRSWNSRDFRLAEGIALWMQQYTMQQYSHLLSHNPPLPLRPPKLMELSDSNTSDAVNTDSIFAWPFQSRGGNSYTGRKKKKCSCINGWKSTCLWAAAVCWTQLLFSLLPFFPSVLWVLCGFMPDEACLGSGMGSELALILQSVWPMMCFHVWG